jgi:hypothetical protein
LIVLSSALWLARDNYALNQSFFPALAILHICAALDPHTDGIVNAKQKGSASHALTSLAGQTYHPHDGWRCTGN